MAHPHSGRSETPAPGGSQPDGLQQLTHSLGAWWSVAGACQREMLEFVSRRLEKDGITIRQVMSAKDWTDTLTVQGQWLEDTMRDYSEEATKVIGICGRLSDPSYYQTRASEHRPAA
jgi:hypothetical protein